MKTDEIRRVIERIVRQASNWPSSDELPDDMRLLGLDSLAVLHVAIDVERSLRVALDPSDFSVYRGLSIDSLANAVLQASRREPARSGAAEGPWLGMDEAQWTGSSFRDLLLARRTSRAWSLRQRDLNRPWLDHAWSRDGLLGAASGIAALMLERGLNPGDLALVDLPGPADRAVALVACLLIGVPVCFSRASSIDVGPLQEQARLRAQVLAVGATALISAQTLNVDIGVTKIRFDRCPRVDPDDLPPFEDPGSAPALLLWSSGSSGVPKLFRPSRQQLLTALWHVGHSLELTRSDRIAGWLPHHHNFGLNLTTLLPLLTNIQTVLMPQACWSQDPLSFLHLLSESRATVTFVPSSALAILSELAERARCANIDLSNLRLLVCSGEPASPILLDRTADALTSLGLRRSALTFQYGMTETTSTIAQSPIGRPPIRLKVGAYEPLRGSSSASSGQSAPKTMLSSGTVLSCHTVRIVSDIGEPVLAGETGHILVSGGCVAQPAQCSGIPAQAWTESGEYRTGDMGLIADGELFVTGRSDDQIVVDGINIWPAEVEAIAALETPDLHATFLALGLSLDNDLLEKLVVVMECTRHPDDLNELRTKVTSAVYSVCGVAPSRFILAIHPFLARTASGKLDRKLSAKRVAERLNLIV